MLLLQDFIELITVPPGDLIYHLVTLFAIQVVLGIAVGHWNRQRRDPAALRLLVAGAGLALTRVVLMLVAVLDRVGVLSSSAVFPPLERFLDLAILLLVVWAFLPILQWRPRLGVVLLLIALVAGLVMYAASALLWLRVDSLGGVAYNRYSQATVWELLAIGILILALVATVLWRRGNWGLIVCLFALWLAGHALQVVTPSVGSHSAGWVRLANLAGLPLLAGLVYRHALSASQATDAGVALELVGTLETIRRIERGRDIENALRSTASVVARVLEADMVAIGLALPGPGNKIRVITLHPPTSVMLANQHVVFPASDYPMLTSALKAGEQQRLYTPQSGLLDAGGGRPSQKIGHDPLGAPHLYPAVDALYQRLGFEQAGPLLVQPLADGGLVMGAMLVGNPISRRRWTAHDEHILEVLGAAIAASLSTAHRRETFGQSAELKRALSRAHRAAQRTAELEAEIERQRQRAEELAARLRLREQEAASQSQTTEEVASWQDELRDLAETRVALEAELAEWKEKAEQLDYSESSLRKRLAQVQAELQEAQKQAASPALVTRPADAGLGGTSEEETTATNEMVASLVHELRTPITSINGYTELLLNEEVGILGATQRQFLLRVMANIERTGPLLDDLLRVTAIDAGRISIAPEPVDMIGVIEDTTMSLSAQLSERNLAVQLDMPLELPLVQADRDSLNQIVTNLLSNAIQCSEPGSEIVVRARLSEREDQFKDLPDYLLVSVTDTGGGIDPGDQARVFQRLYRADNPLIAGLGETGVGLSVAKTLVEAHGGRIWVESVANVGSTFSFILPLSAEADNGRRPVTSPFEELGPH